MQWQIWVCLALRKPQKHSFSVPFSNRDLFSTTPSCMSRPLTTLSTLTQRTQHLFSLTYSLFLKSGNQLSPHLATSLITHFNSLLSGYAQFHLTSSCFSLFNRILGFGFVPDVYTLSSLVKSCERVREIEISHVGCVKFGVGRDPFVASCLVGKYGGLGFVEAAERCFEECEVVDTVVWTAMINGYVWNGELEKGRNVFQGMRELGLTVNGMSVTSVVGVVWDTGEGEAVRGFGVKMGLFGEWSNHLSNALMAMYVRCGRTDIAVEVFEEIVEPDVVSWSTRISASCDGKEAVGVLKAMRSRDVEANEFTLINVLSVIEGREMMEHGKQVHLLGYKIGYLRVVAVANALVAMYGKCGRVGDARRTFEEMDFRDSISQNSLIGAYAGNGLISPALLMFSSLRSSSIEVDRYAMASVLEAASYSNSAAAIMQIHGYLIKIGFLSDDSMLCCLMTSYGKCNSMDEAKKVFYENDTTNQKHLQVLVSSAVNTDHPGVALELFNSTASFVRELDNVLLSVVLKACSALTNLGQGMAIHCVTLKSGVFGDRFVESAVVDFYCKCGLIADAENAWKDTFTGNLTAFNALMMGYAQHGRHKKVLELFNAMLEFGLQPDVITYLGILTSCSHVGLINEAHYHLNSMFTTHGVSPCLEHYSCVVDLLGRVGLVEEAKRTIDEMPINPDAQIWLSLLASCNMYGKLDLGKLAANELLALQPENDSAYVLLSSLHAKAGDLDVAGRLRRELKEKVKHKEPGYSWIELGGTMSYFLAEDTFHLNNDDIHRNLMNLYEQMYLPFELDEDF